MLQASSESGVQFVPPACSSRRLVIVADNSLIVEAIRLGFRKNGEFNLVGHADGRRTSAATLVGAKPDVILLDDMERSPRALELVEEIHGLESAVAVILLSVNPDPDWLERAFAVGATGVISKATHPIALATLVRETLNGHIFHCHPGMRVSGSTVAALSAAEDLPLTARELEILRLVASGATNEMVARQLWVTEQTVKFHLRNIYRKLDVANRTEASHFAHLRGLVQMPAQPGPGSRGQLAVVA